MTIKNKVVTDNPFYKPIIRNPILVFNSSDIRARAVGHLTHNELLCKGQIFDPLSKQKM